MCRKAREKAPPAPSWRKGWYRQFLDSNYGDLSEAELLKAAGASRYNQCEAHFFVGMTKLAESDRRAAQEHFRASVATRILTYPDYSSPSPRAKWALTPLYIGGKGELSVREDPHLIQHPTY